jgi:perosamine synthetase
LNIPAARLVFSPEDRAEILGLIDESLQTGSLTLGARTRELEASFAARHQSRHAVAVSSGTSALEITLRVLGVAGREVVVPANTFFATSAAVLHAGATPRFADIAESSLALTAETVEAALTPQTVGVIIVHVGGIISPDVIAIRELCDRRGLFLVEDAAHAHGCSLGGRSAGTFGVAGTFSFYPTKVITAGEGGMIVTADDRLREEAVVYRDQGKAGFLGGEHIRLGYAWRMSEVHAAIASVHLRRLEEFIAPPLSSWTGSLPYSFRTRPFRTTTNTSPCWTETPTATRSKPACASWACHRPARSMRPRCIANRYSPI